MNKQGLPKIKYILVCDDMREEKDSRKFTLLGLYSGKIILDEIPALLPKLAFRICIAPIKVGDTITLDLIRPDGKLIGSGEVKIELDGDHRGEAFVSLILAPFPIEVNGPYKLVLKKGEKKSSAVAFEAVHKAPK